jgi:hypothetical protein
MLEKLDEEKFLRKIIFSDEPTLNVSGKVSKYNVRIWGSEVSVVCHLSHSVDAFNASIHISGSNF